MRVTLARTRPRPCTEASCFIFTRTRLFFHHRRWGHAACDQRGDDREGNQVMKTSHRAALSLAINQSQKMPHHESSKGHVWVNVGS